MLFRVGIPCVAAVSFPFPDGDRISERKSGLPMEHAWAGVSKKLGRRGEGWGEKESPAVNLKHFTELRLPTNGEQ